jgi:hypothetical protein
MIQVPTVRLASGSTSIHFAVNQTNHFFNLGYGWLCKHCSAAESEARHRSAQSHGHNAPPPHLALARWTDGTRQSLKCPECGIEELVSKS